MIWECENSDNCLVFLKIIFLSSVISEGKSLCLCNFPETTSPSFAFWFPFTVSNMHLSDAPTLGKRPHAWALTGIVETGRVSLRKGCESLLKRQFSLTDKQWSMVLPWDQELVHSHLANSWGNISQPAFLGIEGRLYLLVSRLCSKTR